MAAVTFKSVPSPMTTENVTNRTVKAPAKNGTKLGTRLEFENLRQDTAYDFLLRPPTTASSGRFLCHEVPPDSTEYRTWILLPHGRV